MGKWELHNLITNYVSERSITEEVVNSAAVKSFPNKRMQLNQYLKIMYIYTSSIREIIRSTGSLNPKNSKLIPLRQNSTFWMIKLLLN